MAEYQLVVSNPPHRSPDPLAVAPHLGSSAAEVRMRLNFPAPEIWLAESDKDAARQATKSLIEAGVNVAWIPGSVVAAIPRRVTGVSATLNAEKVVINTADGDLQIVAGDRVVVVVGEPVAQDSRPVADRRSILTQKVPGRGPVRNLPFVGGIATGVAVGVGGVVGYQALNKIDQMAADARDAAGTRIGDMQANVATELFLDIYALGGEGWKPVRLTQSCTDFSGLGEAKQPSGRANLTAIKDAIRERCGARVDERLVKVTYKPAIVSGIALNQVLRAISEQLAAQPLLDIGAGLAFLTSKG